MRHRIIKLTSDEEKYIGDLIINSDGSLFVDSQDDFLKNWLEELNGEEIISSEGVGGTNEEGNKVYAEIARTVKPEDVDFINALQKYFPEDYFLLELFEEETIHHRKTA
jgi:hypothetical protein